MSPLRQEEARKYAAARRRLSLGDLSLGAVCLLLLVFGGISLRLAAMLDLPAVGGAVVYLVVLMVGYGLLSAPLGYYLSLIHI